MPARPKPVPEHKARGDTAQVYHEIRQSLRVSGVNLNFRTWAGFPHFLPIVWRASRPVVETAAFEDAADHLRAIAAGLAGRMGAAEVKPVTPLGESQCHQLQAALRLYHYINPKLLVLTSAIAQTLETRWRIRTGEPTAARLPLIRKGIPGGMYPMEMVEEQPRERAVRRVFRDIKKTLRLESINSDYRTLALWPEYLEGAWGKLKAVIAGPEYGATSDELRNRARDLAVGLPRPVILSPADFEAIRGNLPAIRETTSRFERVLSGLILNIALLALDWEPMERLAASPFPAHRLEG